MSRVEQIGDATLYMGDCLDVMAGLDTVDAVVTDIPYNISQEHGGLREIDYGEWDKNFNWKPAWERIKNIAGRWAVWCGDVQVSEILMEMRGEGLARKLCWVKPNPNIMNGQHHWLAGSESCAAGKRSGEFFGLKCHKGWWLCPPDLDRKHPTQKPVVIISDQVRAYSRRGETILDPFMGSGTTGVACANLGRKFIGIEIEEKYFDIACRRIEQAQSQLKMDFGEREKPEQMEIENV